MRKGNNRSLAGKGRGINGDKIRKEEARNCFRARTNLFVKMNCIWNPITGFIFPDKVPKKPRIGF